MGCRAVLAGVVVAFGVTGAAWAAEPATIGAAGVTVSAPEGWTRVKAAADGPAADPRTVLVAGTDGVEPRRSHCQVSAYRVPDDGAAVVVLGWRGRAVDGVPRDRDGLESLRLRRPYFQCWAGRGASALLAIRGRAYQVNVLVGDEAASQTVAQALRVARSFRAADAP